MLVLLVCLGLALATVVTYWPVGANQFVDYDDGRYVRDNAVVKRGLTAAGLDYAFTTREGGNWHPLVWLSFMADVDLWGMNPAGHHASNVALHVVNALLIFLVLVRTTGAPWPSAFVAGAFALHPLHVESVAWVAERKDTLSTLFWMTTILAYTWYAERPSLMRYGLVLASFACGLMSKAMLVTLPLVLLLLDYWPLGRLGRPTASRWLPASWDRGTLVRLATEKLPMLALVVVIAVVTVRAQHEAGAVGSTMAFPVSARIANAVVAYMVYLGKMLWPTNLAVLYPYLKDPSGPGVIAALTGLLGLSGLALALAARAPWVAVGWFWYLGTLVPVIGLVQVGNQSWADRYTYIPLIGIFIAVAFTATELVVAHAQRIVLGTVAVAVLVVWGVVAQAQLRTWRDTQTLYEQALRVTTDNYVIHHNLGKVLQDKRQTDAAIEHYLESVRINPKFPPPRNNLGILLAERGRMTEAIEHYTRGVELDPRNADVHNNLANALSGAGRFAEAEPQFREALRLRPTANIYTNYALQLILVGRFDDAVASAESALRMDPRYPQAHSVLATALAKQGRPADAIAHYREALRLMPGWPAAQRRLAWVLATYPDPSVRNATEAVDLAQLANQKTGDKDPDTIDALAAAYAEAGRFSEAAETADRAAAQADRTGKSDLAGEMRARATLYRSGRPYRDVPGQGTSPAS